MVCSVLVGFVCRVCFSVGMVVIVLIIVMRVMGVVKDYGFFFEILKSRVLRF